MNYSKKEASVTMHKNIKRGLLLVVSAFALIGCGDEISSASQVKDYNSPIVVNKDGESQLKGDIYNNIMTSIYDGIHDGSLPSDTLDKVFYQYSISMFGKYNDASEGVKEGEITITAAVAAGKESNTFKDFLDAHPVYKNADNDLAKSFDAVSSKLQSIKDRIAVQMYDKMNADSYKFRSDFYEIKFLKALRKDNEAVADPYDSSVTVYNPQLILPSVEKKDVFANFLNVENYGGDRANGITYIEDKILPGIYRSLLTEQYISVESPLSIGRSYARKVNIIELEDNADYELGINYLLENYITKVSKKAVGEDRNKDVNTYSFVRAPKTTLGDNKVTKDDFDILNQVINGVATADSNAGKLMAEAAGKENSFFKEGEYESYKYYEGTEYSSLIKSYKDIYKDESHYKEFTDGTYPTSVGLELKRKALQLKDHVKNGWFIKSDLSSYSFADKLFDLKVATAIDKSEKDPDSYDRYYKKDGESTWTLGGRERDYGSYVCRINGSYFLKNTENDKTNPNGDILFRDGSKYYIVQIEEAVSSSKYHHDIDPTITDEVVKNEVLKLIATTGSYESLAKEYWIEKMNVVFFDEAVYNYFKDTYPDIYED